MTWKFHIQPQETNDHQERARMFEQQVNSAKESESTVSVLLEKAKFTPSHTSTDSPLLTMVLQLRCSFGFRSVMLDSVWGNRFCSYFTVFGDGPV